MSDAPMIFKAITSAMNDIGPISKEKRNQAQGYNFRGIDDVYNELQPIMAKHGIFTTSEIISERSEDRTTSKGSVLIYRILRIKWRFHAVDGTSVSTETIGEGMDSGDKASNKAMSVAHKYALLQVFAIPTDDAKDPEHDNHDVKPRTQPAKPQATQKNDRQAIGQQIGEILKDPKFTEADKSNWRDKFKTCPDIELDGLLEFVKKARDLKNANPDNA
jgi:hypothetical protein